MEKRWDEIDVRGQRLSLIPQISLVYCFSSKSTICLTICLLGKDIFVNLQSNIEMQTQNMKRSILLLTVMMLSTIGWAQEDISGKLSITSQMFLDERDGKITTDPAPLSKTPMVGVPIKEKHRGKRYNRIYASPDTIDGKAYISCFVRLNDMTSVGDLKAKGVEVQCEFQNGLVTALIPVDSLERVAQLRSVRRVNVSPLMRPTTNAARQATNVDDLLTNSADAVGLGLTSTYDGSGVVLGVIDTGIDFQHVAFKDKDGNSRIKRAYIYNGQRAAEVSNITSSSPTTDDTSEDHGTHTSSAAGGSSVVVSGNTVTVTDDHANATYGGMAPGADLYLCGINGLSSTYLANAMKKICDYADSQGKPCVVSNSWGSQLGPHDGTGDIADVTAQFFGPSHPNHICLFAASNDAGKCKDNEGGGYYMSGTASKTNPLGSILRSATYINTDAGYFYQGILANAWSRSRLSSGNLGCKILVLNSQTGAVLTSVSVDNPSLTGTSVTGLTNYYSGTLTVYRDYVSANKNQLILYSGGLTSKSTTRKTKDGEDYYVSNYTLAVQFYPTSGSCDIDAWGGDFSYYANYLRTSGYTWSEGSDNSSASDEATDSNVIAIGAYVSKNRVTDYKGVGHDMSGEFTVGDIASFSSFQTQGQGPTGEMIPWITAPGATVVSAVNHYHTSGNYSYIDDSSAEVGMYRVNASTTSPYGSMEGTSMATPVAAGIVALWLQAATEVGKSMTNEDIKEVMRETAIQDAYTTTGKNATHFGYGKIDALAGVQYILGAGAGPVIKAQPSELTFSGYAGRTYTQSIKVTGTKLEKDIQVSLSDGEEAFSVSRAEISVDEATEGYELQVTYAPTAEGEHMATLTLTSEQAEDVTIILRGSAIAGRLYTITYDAGTGNVEHADWVQEDFEQAATLPVATSRNEDWTFLGWSTVAIDSTTTAPTLLEPGSTYQPTSDVTLYAVYTRLISGGSIDGYVYTTTFESGADYLFVTSNQAGSSYALDAVNLKNKAGKVAATAVTIRQEGDYLVAEPTATGQVWSVSGTTTSATVKNGSATLSIGSGGLSKSTNTTVRWNDNYGLYGVVSSWVSSTNYYVVTSGSNLSASTSASTTNRLYMYRKTSVDTTIRAYTSNPWVEPDSQPGDITKDGQWDVMDVTALVDIILGKATPEDSSYDFEAADVDGDGQFTVSDVTKLVDIILGKDL